MKEYIFRVHGMSCGMCEAHVNDAVRNAVSVKNVRSSAADEKTTVIAEELDTDRLISAVRASGYEIEDSFECRPYQKKRFLGIF